jgi:hypothetical protein
MKKKAILVASALAVCACASGPHVPKGPPPEYEDPQAPSTSAATSGSAHPENAAPPSGPKTSDAGAD